MALLFIDSFDHYATADLTEKWTSIASGTPTITPSNGRRSSASLHASGGSAVVLKGLASTGPTVIAGVAYKASLLGSVQRIMGVYDNAISRDQFYIQTNADGSISAFRGGNNAIPGAAAGTLLGAPSAAGVLSAGVFAYIEMKGTIHPSTGTVVVRVNGSVVLNLSGQNTSFSGTTVWTGFWLSAVSGVSPVVDLDDCYVCDAAGAAPWNDFLGDCRVDVRLPTAAGATTGWAPSAGANWAAVDDAAPNDDTDYTAATAAGVTDTFTVQDAPVVGAAIYGVQHCISVKKTDAGAASIAPVIRHGGTDNVGANLNPGTTYAYVLQMAALNPGTGAAWTEAGFNAAEFGYKRTV